MKSTHTTHPKTLRIFFATEMWERYGFYVVQTLLALYLALHFKWPDKDVYGLVGSFTALTYMSPVVGGWIADRLLGQKLAILLGALVLLLSYFFLSLMTTSQTLCVCLAGIVVGTGLLKPNISSLLGNEYPEGATNRESGFTIFYMGLTTGIILGTFLPSYLGEQFGWSVAFISAAAGMVIAASIFLFGIYYYRIQDYHQHELTLRNFMFSIGSIGILWGLVFYILNYPLLADIVFVIVVIFSLFYVINCVKDEAPAQARQTIVLGILCLISVLFWAFYFQMFMSLTLFISRVVNPSLFGVPFPPPFYVGVQSIGMIILGMMLSRSRQTLPLNQQIIRIGNKFLIAIACMTIAYGLITIICHFNFPYGLLSPFYLIPAYLVISLAELLLSPVGLSAVTVLASRKKVSTMMGIFFISLGLGAFLAGKLATITAISTTVMSITMLKAHYANAFATLLMILLIATVTCIMLNAVIHRLMKRASC